MLAGQQPYKAIIEEDMAFFAGVATQDPEVVDAVGGVCSYLAGTTPAEFDAQVREAYTSGAERSLAKANELGWNVVSMSNDWITVF